jgi:hypothetical protein
VSEEADERAGKQAAKATRLALAALAVSIAGVLVQAFAALA